MHNGISPLKATYRNHFGSPNRSVRGLLSPYSYTYYIDSRAFTEEAHADTVHLSRTGTQKGLPAYTDDSTMMVSANVDIIGGIWKVEESKHDLENAVGFQLGTLNASESRPKPYLVTV